MEPESASVFVVHGRDNFARNQIFTFLRALGLQPMEWTEAVRRSGTASPYVGQVLDSAFGVAQAVLVLLTPDDLARLREELLREDDPAHERSYTGQSRANVLFEAGMAMGRSPDRTVLVEWGHVKPFSDIGGRHVIRLGNSPEKRQELAQRLRSAGCAVNTENTDWLSAGDFRPESLTTAAKRARSSASRPAKPLVTAHIRKTANTRYVMNITNPDAKSPLSNVSVAIEDPRFAPLDPLQAPIILPADTAHFSLTGPDQPPEDIMIRVEVTRGRIRRSDTVITTIA